MSVRMTWPPHFSLRGRRFIVTWTGAATSITTKDTKPRYDLVKPRKPPLAIVGKAIEVMVEASGRPEAGGTVGTRIVWARVPADPNGEY
jgi:hypothetical protein